MGCLKAVRLLELRYGKFGLRWRAIANVVGLLIVLIIVIAEASGGTHIIQDVVTSARSAVGAALGIGAFTIASVSPIRAMLEAGSVSSVSRGQIIYDQASSVKDNFGFMDQVKTELLQLFSYMRKFRYYFTRMITLHYSYPHAHLALN